jgi:hypothetical protein
MPASSPIVRNAGFEYAQCSHEGVADQLFERFISVGSRSVATTTSVLISPLTVLARLRKFAVCLWVSGLNSIE